MFNYNFSSPENNSNFLLSYNYLFNQINPINQFNSYVNPYNEILKLQYLLQNGYNIIPEQNLSYNYLLMPQNMQIPNVNYNYIINNLYQKQKIINSNFNNIPPVNCYFPSNNNINNNNKYNIDIVNNKDNINYNNNSKFLCSDSNQNIEGKIIFYNYIFRKIFRKKKIK
jgi:hypothetical protein